MAIRRIGGIIFLLAVCSMMVRPADAREEPARPPAGGLPVVRVLALLSPDYPSSPENPVIHLAVMESLAPVRMEFACPYQDQNKYHALDGQSLFSGGHYTDPADAVLAKAIEDTLAARHYDVLWLFGSLDKFDAKARDALKAAQAAGVPVLAWNASRTTLLALGVPDLPRKNPMPADTEGLAPAFPNFDFEAAQPPGPVKAPNCDDEIPAGTFVASAGEPDCRIGWAAKGRSGAHSLKVHFPGGRNGVWARLGELDLPRDLDLRDVPFTIAGWIAGPGGGSLLARDANTGQEAAGLGQIAAPDAEWHPFAVTVRLPEVKDNRLLLEIRVFANCTIYLDEIRMTPPDLLRSRARQVAEVRARYGGTIPKWEKAGKHPLLDSHPPDSDLPELAWSALPGLPGKQAGGFEPLIFSTFRNEAGLAAFADARGTRMLLASPGGAPLLRNGSESQDAWFWYRTFCWLTGKTIPPPRLAPAAKNLAELTLKTTPEFVPPGQAVKLETTPQKGVAAAPGQVLDVLICDMHGRLLDRLTLPAEGAGPWTVEWQVPDYGPCGVYFPTRVVLRGADTRADSTVAEGHRTIYAARRFDPRERIAYGVWLGHQAASDLVMRFLQRFYDNAGVDTMATHVRPEVLERYGWFGQVESGNGGIDMQFGWPTASFAEIVERSRAGFMYAQSTAYTLSSWGEEPGFGPAWGTVFHWPTDADVPPAATNWFRRYLHTKYKDIAQLNRAWQANYADWSQVPFSKANLGPTLKPEQAGEDVKNLMLSKQIKLDAATDTVLPHIGKYLDTDGFFNWHFDGVVNAMVADALDRYPWTQHFMSSPNRFHPVTPIPSAYNHPFYAKENSLLPILTRRAQGYDFPPARLDWYFMDDPWLQLQAINQQLATGTSLLMAWYDMPLQFNFDLTASQGGARMNRVLAGLRDRAEGPFLQQYADLHAPVGILGTGGAMFGIEFPHFVDLVPCILQTGQMPRYVLEKDVADPALKVLFFGQPLASQETLKNLRAFAERGGTLIAIPGAAAWDEAGVPAGMYMAPEVVALTGVARTYGIRKEQAMSWRDDSPIRPDFSPARGTLLGFECPLVTRHEAARIVADDVAVCAAYADGTPAITTRAVGSGRAIYLNAECGPDTLDSGHLWHHGSVPRRYSFTRIFQAIFAASGVPEALPRLVNGASDLGPHQVLWERKQNATLDISYIFAYVDTRAGELPARVLAPRGAMVRELMSGTDLAADADGSFPLQFERGAFKLAAVRAADPSRMKITLAQSKGRHVAIGISLGGKREWAGQRPVRVRFIAPDGREVRRLRRWISVTGHAEISHRIALDDAPGTWTIEAWEPIADLKASGRLKVAAGEKPAEPPSTALHAGTPEETVSLLRQLSSVYRTGSGRVALSYYLHARGGDCRHAIMRHLERLDWLAAEKQIIAALEAGETFLLTGEDVGIFPGAATPTQGLFENRALPALQRLVDRADRVVVPRGWPSTIICTIGKGRLVLDRTSIDETFPPDNWGSGKPSGMAAWVEEWRRMLDSQDSAAMEKTRRVRLSAWLTAKQ